MGRINKVPNVNKRRNDDLMSFLKHTSTLDFLVRRYLCLNGKVLINAVRNFSFVKAYSRGFSTQLKYPSAKNRNSKRARREEATKKCIANVKAVYGSHKTQTEQTTAPVILAIFHSF